MNQSFNRQQLIRLCKQAEFVDYGLTLTQLGDNLDETFESINKDEFTFEITKVNEYYLTHDLPNKLVLRKLNDNLKRLYKDEQANRRIIISQVKTLLEERMGDASEDLEYHRLSLKEAFILLDIK